jgi:PAS domain S-box-containing protein
MAGILQSYADMGRVATLLIRRAGRLGTTAKIAVGFGATFVLALAIGAVSWLSSVRLANDLDYITGTELPCHRYVAAMYAAQNDIQARLSGLAVEADPDRRHALEGDVDGQIPRAESHIRDYESLPHGQEEERLWQAMRGPLTDWFAVARAQRALETERDLADDHRNAGTLSARTIEGLQRLRRLDSEVDEAFDRLIAQLNGDAESRRQQAMDSVAAVKRALVSVVLICGAMTAALAFAAGRAVKQSEAARRSEAEKVLLARRLELIASYSSDILFLCEPSGQIIEANRSAATAHGYQREEILALNIRDVLAPEARGNVGDRGRQAEAGRTIFESLHVRKDGSTFPVEVSLSVIDVDGRPFFLGVARDITERKRADEERSFQLTLLETLHDAVIGLDTGLRVRSWNPAAARLYGCSAEEVFGRDVAEVFESVHPGGEAGRLRRLGELAPGSRVRAELAQQRKNGTRIVVESEAAALRGPDGHITGYLLANRDVAERKQAEEAAAASRAKSAFLASMSHEIRTPLNAILGYAQVLERDAELSERARRSVGIINHSGEHLLALINDILEMSKIEAGRSTLNRGTFDLHRLLDDLEAMFQLRAREKGLSFRVATAEEVPRFVVADEGKVRQILVNLLGNAVKFTRDGGVALWVRIVKRAGERLRLVAEVDDTGVGIEAHELGRLFEPFGQTRSGQQALEGTGLGLAISREHARLMNGDLQVTSEAGKGTLVRFEFPVEEGGQAECAAHLPPRRVVRLAGAVPRILLVDDHEVNRGWLRELLTTIGFEVREATNGQEAVESWRAWKPDAVLMDVHMPLMDGHEATRVIRAEERGEDVVIIALTASVFREDRQDVLRSGADDFVGKPVREAELLEKIRTHLGIEYVYADVDAADAVKSAAPGRELLTPGALSSLPDATLRALRDATRGGDIDRLRTLIGELEDTTRPVADALRVLVDGFDYEGLHRALGPSAT